MTRILIVEDETIVAMDISTTLQRLGYTVAGTAGSGDEAIAAARATSPDLVLMDIRIKGPRDGIETATVISAERAVPIVFLTAHADVDTVERSRIAAPHGYLLKPFDERTLHRTIELALSRAAAESVAQQTAVDALWQSEERFRLMVDAVREYAIFLLDPEARIRSWNSGAERITGFSSEEVVGKSVGTLLARNDGDLTRIAELIDGSTRDGGAQAEVIARRRDGSDYSAHVYIAPIVRDDRILGYVSITKDITAQRSLEAQLLEAQKLESVGRLAGGIAHDFNNMLMVILTRCELLARLVTTDQQRKSVRDIRDAAMKNRDLTQQLLAIARRQVLEPEVLDLNRVVHESVQLLGPTLGEHVETRVALEPQLWNVLCDPGKLHQVIMNLAINARDAMPQGGSLLIETRNVRADDAYARQHVGIARGDYVALVVSDTGTGIPREIRDRIFDPFFTTKPTGEGSGLGLAVVRGIVEQNNGAIWMYTEEGRGTTFKIFIPRHRGGQAAGVVPDDVAAAGGAGETILLVEDEQLLRDVLRETLEEQGYVVLAAASPDEALELNARWAGPVHLLLTDIVMHGMDGRTLATQLCALRPGLPVVLMSGYSDQLAHTNGALTGKVRFIEKPITTNALLTIIRAAVEDSRQG